MEGNAALQLFNIPTVVVTLGVTAFIIADGKGRDPVAWVFFAVTLAIIAFPALLLVKNERAVRVPYAMKAIAAFSIGVCIYLGLIALQGG
jgi:hypothetical protein